MSEYYVGLDVSMKKTYVWVLNACGDTVRHGEVATDPVALSSYLADIRDSSRLCIETGSLSHWLCSVLAGNGFSVVCADARHMACALSARVNKNDRNDAQGIARMLRVGLVRPVAVKSEAGREVQMLMSARRQLVESGRALANSARGLLKNFGIRLPTTLSHARLIEAVKEHFQAMSATAVLALQGLLDSLQTISEQLVAMNRQVKKLAGDDGDCALLMSAPGVGPITALTFKTALDTPERFKDSRNVGAYMGLTPKQYASGEVNRQGAISRQGPKECRHLLYEASHVLLTRSRLQSKLKSWGLKLAKKKGMRKATVAVARKLSVILHQMLVTRTPFQPQGA